MKNVVILKDEEYFPQTIVAWKPLDVEYIKNYFEEKGFGVHIYTYEEIVNKDFWVKDSYIIYASSQIPERKQYIDDALCFIKNENCLIPGYDIFRCHENKGYQELYKRKIGFRDLSVTYHTSYPQNDNGICFPMVVKKVAGYGACGVWKVDNFKEFLLIGKKFQYKKSLGNVIKELIKRMFFKVNPLYQRYKDTFYGQRVVFQEFIPALTFDYKILVFGDKYYVLKRRVRKNDFRASGSGLWEFPEPQNLDTGVLDFALRTFSLMDVPFISFDICESEGKYHLIEFQGVHFGPATLINSKGYFTKKDSAWAFVIQKSDLQEEYCLAIWKFINRISQNENE